MSTPDHEANAEKLTELLEVKDEKITELQAEMKSLYHAAAQERNEVEDTLAQALGYEYDEEYGYAIGDHVSTSLAMEASRKIGELQQENSRHRQTLASIIVSNEPPTQADIDRAHELVERGDIED